MSTATKPTLERKEVWPASLTLQTAIASAWPGLRDAYAELANSEKRVWVEYMVVVHHIIQASVPLLEAARASDEWGSASPYSQPIANYLAQHIQEEADHDEWLLDDLSSVGISRSDVEGRVPSRQVASLVGAMYYWIRHGHPAAIFGYMGVLEGYPPDPAQLYDIERSTGLPHSTFQTFHHHASVDASHSEELFNFVDSVAWSQRARLAMSLAGVHTAQGYESLLRHLTCAPT